MNDYKYSHILAAVTEMPWAIMPSKLAIIRDLLHIRASGYELTAEEVRASMNGREPLAAMGAVPGQQRTAVLPLVGTIIPRAG
ncbi:MAG: hypothetical protein HC804_00170 [Anaerolineae bacterium]|nr:hypothetical protein [Anaerolineae bacterium]